VRSEPDTSKIEAKECLLLQSIVVGLKIIGITSFERRLLALEYAILKKDGAMIVRTRPVIND
jgi:hypothetical protein